MTLENSHFDAEKRLWEQFKASAADPMPEQIDDLDVAAWLDGRATDELSACVEAALAVGGAGLTPGDALAIREAICDAADSTTINTHTLARITRRARLLDPAQSSDADDSERGVLFVFPAIRRGLAAAAAIGICVLGWHAGQMLAAPNHAMAIDSNTLTSEMTFGLMGATNADSELLAFELASFSAEEVTR